MNEPKPKKQMLAIVAVLAAGPGLDGGARADEALIAGAIEVQRIGRKGDQEKDREDEG